MRIARFSASATSEQGEVLHVPGSNLRMSTYLATRAICRINHFSYHRLTSSGLWLNSALLLPCPEGVGGLVCRPEKVAPASATAWASQGAGCSFPQRRPGDNGKFLPPIVLLHFHCGGSHQLLWSKLVWLHNRHNPLYTSQSSIASMVCCVRSPMAPITS